MPRPHREILPGGVYQVVSRGNNQQFVFQENQDYQVFLIYLKDYLQVYGLKIYLYVLMANHFHLLLKVSSDESTSLSAFMQCLCSRYTKYFNRKYRRSGHLFQGRFYSNLITSDAHLLELTRYIHLNPCRAGSAENPRDYPYSSYGLYRSNPDSNTEKSIISCDCEEILSLFGVKRTVQQKRYMRFVEDNITLRKLRVYKTKLQLNALTGVRH